MITLQKFEHLIRAPLAQKPITLTHFDQTGSAILAHGQPHFLPDPNVNSTIILERLLVRCWSVTCAMVKSCYLWMS